MSPVSLELFWLYVGVFSVVRFSQNCQDSRHFLCYHCDDVNKNKGLDERGCLFVFPLTWFWSQYRDFYQRKTVLGITSGHTIYVVFRLLI